MQFKKIKVICKEQNLPLLPLPVRHFFTGSGSDRKRLTAPAAYRYSFTPFFFRMMVLTVRTFTPYQSSEYPSP